MNKMHIYDRIQNYLIRGAGDVRKEQSLEAAEVR